MRFAYFFYLPLFFAFLLLSGCREDCPDGCPLELPLPDTSTSLSFTVIHAVRGTERYTFGNSTSDNIRSLPFGFTKEGNTSTVGTIGEFQFYFHSLWDLDRCNTLKPFYWRQTATTDFYLLPSNRALLLEFTGLDSTSPDCYPSREELLGHLAIGSFPIGSDPGGVHLFLSGRYVGHRPGDEPGSYFMDLDVPQQNGVLTITEIDTESARYSLENKGIFVTFTIDQVDVLDHMWYDPEPYILTDISGRMFLPME
jgi:hypothetical protein